MGTMFGPQFRDSCLLDLLQRVNSSVSPEIHESKWPVNWEKNRVDFIVIYTVSLWYE